MNKTAAEVALAKKLLRVASRQTDKFKQKTLVQKAAAILKKGGPVQATVHDKTAEIERTADERIKKAFKEESAAFVAWVLSEGKKWRPEECQRVLDKLKVPLQESPDAPKRGPLEKGETVRPDKFKNKNPQNVDECEAYHDRIGTIVDVERGFVIVEFGPGKKVRFEGNTSGTGTGLYRHTPAGSGGSGSRAMVEVVYIKDKNAPAPDKRRMVQIQEYVEAGIEKGEERYNIYYSGLPLKQAIGKDGSYYFTVFAQQRAAFPTTMNPTKGDVLYIGRVGGRPGGWKADLAKKMAQAEAEGDAGGKE